MKIIFIQYALLRLDWYDGILSLDRLFENYDSHEFFTAFFN